MTPSRGNLRTGPVCTLAKFVQNVRPNTDIPVISRTFGKVAIVDKLWAATMQAHIPLPQHNEWWVVDIIKDQIPGTNKGLLFMRPRYPIQTEETTRLFPGTFEEDVLDGVLYVYPKHPGPYWIAAVTLKEMLLQRHNNPPTVIVPIIPPADAPDRAAALLKR